MRPDHTPFVLAHLANTPTINTTGLTLDAARIAHLQFALRAVPEHLLSWSESKFDMMKHGGDSLLLEFGVRSGLSLKALANVSKPQTYSKLSELSELSDATPHAKPNATPKPASAKPAGSKASCSKWKEEPVEEHAAAKI